MEVVIPILAATGLFMAANKKNENKSSSEI